MLRLERGVEEHRAAATVPGSNRQTPIRGRSGDADHSPPVTERSSELSGPLVGVGVASHPIFRHGNPSVKGPLHRFSTEAGQTDGVFAAHSLAPERLQASYSIPAQVTRRRFASSRFFVAGWR